MSIRFIGGCPIDPDCPEPSHAYQEDPDMTEPDMTAEQQRAWDLVPRPNADTGTAAEYSTYYLAQAAAGMKLAQEAMKGAFGEHKDTTAMLDYTDAVQSFVHLFAIGFLMRRVSDDVARELDAWLESGDQADEWTWQWLNEAGVNPDLIRRLSTRQERADHYEQFMAARGAVR